MSCPATRGSTAKKSPPALGKAAAKKTKLSRSRETKMQWAAADPNPDGRLPSPGSPALLSIGHTAKPDRARAVPSGRHQEQLAVLVVAVGLREVPDRSLRLIGAAAAQDRGAGVLVVELVGPLPDVADEILNLEGARA